MQPISDNIKILHHCQVVKSQKVQTVPRTSFIFDLTEGKAFIELFAPKFNFKLDSL